MLFVIKNFIEFLKANPIIGLIVVLFIMIQPILMLIFGDPDRKLPWPVLAFEFLGCAFIFGVLIYSMILLL